MKRTLKENKYAIKVLEAVSRTAEKALDRFDDDIRGLPQVGPHQQDELIFYHEEIEILSERILKQISKLESENEEKKRGIRSSLPQWGGDALEFWPWRRELVKAVRSHISDENKLTSLKKSIILINVGGRH